MMNWTYGYDGMMGSFGFGGFLLMVVWWAIIVYVVALAIRWIMDGTRHEGRHGKSAIDILKERYAKGEIDRKEFEEKKKDIVG